MAKVVIKSLQPLRIHMAFPVWPPSVNNLTTVARGRKIKTQRGRDFMDFILSEIMVARRSVRIPKFDGRIGLVIKMHPATHRRYDLDNMPKAIQDSMTEAGIWTDDSQVYLLALKKCKIHKGGGFSVRIWELPPDFGDDDDE